MIASALKNFNYPENLIKTYRYWHIILRPSQTTLGSLVLICKENISSCSEMSLNASMEKKVIIEHIETILKNLFGYSKINYLTLMMVDPIVHTHVIPRYETAVKFDNTSFEDNSWPLPPALDKEIDISESSRKKVLTILKQEFAKVSSSITKSKKYSRMYTSGSFDIFHYGHLNILKKTKALCDHLIVGVSTDELITKAKGRPPIIPFNERIAVIEALDCVDEVIPQLDKNKQKIVDEYFIDAISVGDDWKGKYPKVSCEMEYFTYTPNVSSTLLKERLKLT